VRSLAGQDPRPEIVVVNSGGGDPGPRLAAEGLEVRVVNVAERLLPGAARNAAVEGTEAPYVAFLAADCVAEPGWVAARLRAHRDGAAAVASVLTVTPTATRSECAAHLLLHRRRTPDTPPEQRLLYGLSYERALLARVGPFREDLRQGEDSELNARLPATATVAWTPDVRTVHRHPRSAWPLLRDQYARGRRRAVALLELDPARARRAILSSGRANVREALAHARRTSDPAERELLLRGRPLLWPAALAYVTGGLSVVVRMSGAPS
jgi:glycosyltransferase involved in cell wall biosynthesis